MFNFKKIQLKHVGYCLLFFTLLVNVYFIYGFFTFFGDYSTGLLSRFGFDVNYSEREEVDTDSAWEHMQLGNLLQVDARVLYEKLHLLTLFLFSMLDAIAVAISLALIVHPANKK